MPNIPLAYVSVYRRMSDIFHTLTYACTIRNSVTAGPLRAFFIRAYTHVKVEFALHPTYEITKFIKGQYSVLYMI